MTLRFRWAHLVVALMLVLGVATRSYAGTITLAWDPSPFEDVAGYVIFYGTTPGTHPYALGVGNQTSATVPGLAGGQLYYFIVQAYSSSDVLGPPSNEVSASTTNAAPQLSGPGTQSSTEGAPIALNVSPFATDADGDPLRYDATGLPPGLAIHPATGLIGGTLSYFAAGTHTVTITVFDGFAPGTLTASASFTWTVANANGPPVVAPIPTQTSAENTAIGLAVVVSDPDSDPVVFSAAGLPPGLTIDSATGVISGALSYTSAGTHLVTAIASDGGVLTGRQTFFWTVANVDRPPVVTLIPPQTSGQYATVLLKVVASDPDGDSVTFAANGLPPGLTIHPTTGRITGTLSPASVGVHAASVTASAAGLTHTQPFTWTVTNQVAFPLKVSASGRYLVDQHHVPFLMTGDSPQAMFVDLNVSEATEYLTDRKNRGFNTVWINLVCKTDNYGCRANGSRYDGQKPFLAGAVDHENVLTPNETYFAQVDQIIAVATSLNLLVILDPMDTGGWTETLKNNSLPSLRAYGQYVGNRYKDVDNIFWLHGVDFQQWRIEAVDAKAREVALGIKDVDPRHLHTVQLDFKLSSSLDDPTWAPIIHVEGVYTYFPTYAEVLKAYNRASFLPVMMVEAAYEEETIFGGGDTGTPETLRRIEYWTVLSGATGQLFGNGTIWKMLTAWPSHLNTPGATQLGYLAALFGARPWFNLVPDQTHTVLTSGYGTFSTTGNVIANDYATAAATPDGSLVMAYVPTARTVTVDMTRLGGPAVARWFDPALGTFSTMITGAPLPNVGLRSFPTPGARADGSGDWVLVLEANPGIMLANPGNRTSSAGTVASLQLVASDPYGDPLTYSATNLPLGLTIHSSTGLIAGTLVHTALTTYPVTVTATDGTLTASQAFTWTVNENTQPPVLTHPGNQTSAGGTVSLQLVATDPDGTGLTYSATGLPPGLTVNSTTGLISGTLAGTTAIYGVTVTASDGFLVSAPQTFTWTVVLSSPFVQANYATPQLDTTTVTVPFTNAQTAGNLNVVAVGWADTIRQVKSIVDTRGNVYQLAVGPTLRSGALSQSIYYAKNITAAAAGANAVTVTFTGAAVYPDIRIAEYRGVDRVNPVDVTAAAQGSSGLSDSGPVTTTHATDLLMAANVTEGVTTAAGSGYTARVLTTPNAQILMDRVVTATGSYTATAPLYVPHGWVLQLVAFRGAAGTLNQPPTLSAVAPQTQTEGTTIALPLSGGDPDGNPLTYSATGLPGGVSLHPVTGVMAGTLTYTSAGVHTVTATVSDQSLTSTQTFTWTVTNVNRAPVLPALADRMGAENTPATLSVTATDPDMDDVLTYSATGLPPGLTIQATTGVISGLPTFTSAGPHVVTVTVNDGRAAANSTATTVFIWTITNTNRAPTLTAIPPQTSAENASVALSVSATDPDDGDGLAYSAIGLPQGLTIHAVTGVIGGTVSYTTSGLHTVTVMVADGQGAANSTASTTFSWTVTNTNRPPTLPAIPSQTSVEHAAITLAVTASDPDGDPVTYGATGLPDGLTMHPTTGAVTGTLSYTSAGTHAVTVTVSDGSLTASQSFTWTVTNTNRAPVLAAIANLTQAENDILSVTASATDPDGDTVTYSATGLPAGVSVGALSGTITGTLSYVSAGPYSVTVTASDATLASSQSFTLTVSNTNRAPVLTAAVDQTSAENATVVLPLAASDPDGGVLAYSATGLPGGLEVNPATGVISGKPSYSSAGAHSVTATVSDGELSNSQTFTWTVTNVNRDPVLTTVANRTDFEDTTISLQLVATDPDGDTLTHNVIGLPAGLSVNTTTGLISGTLTHASAGVHVVTVTISDGSRACIQVFTWTVTHLNREPEVADVASRTDAENATVSLQVVASDPDGDVVTYSAIGLPAGLSINATTGLISGTLSYASAGTHVVTLMVSDVELACVLVFNWTITNVNQLPTLTDVPDRTDPENTLIAIALAGADLDPGTTLTYSATPLPAGITIDPATGLISGTLTYTSAGNSTVTIAVSDGTASAEQTFAWTVSDVNRPPTLTAVPDRTDPENTIVAIALAGADLDPGTTLTYSAAPLPAGVTINPGTGLINGTLTYASAGTYTVAVSVSDGTATADQTFAWTVTNVNQPPTLTDVPDRTDPEDTVIAIALAGADPDPGTTLTYSAAPLPAGLTLNAATGLISGTLTYASAGTATVTVSVSDGSAAAEQTFTWIVTDVNQPPTLTGVPDRTDPENTVVAITLAGADQDPGTTLTYSAAPLPAGVTINPGTGLISGTLTYASAGTYPVTVSVSDGTASAEQTFTWTVTNVNQPPTLTDVPDRTDPENTIVAIALAAAELDPGTTLTYSATPLPAGMSINPGTGLINGTLTHASAGTATVTVSVSDGTASAEQTFTWTVTNVNQPPTLTDVPDRTDPENTIVALALAGADLDPGTTLTYSATPLPAGLTLNAATGLISGTLTYASAGAATVTVSVSDGSAAAEQTFTWIVTDVNQPPTLTGVPDRTDPENTVVAITLAGADQDPGTTLTYSAAPLPAGVTINPGTGLISGTLTYASAGSDTVTVSVSDGTAAATQTFTWTVSDVNRAPTLTDVPDRTDPENTIIAITLAGADLDSGTTLTYNAASLPAGVTINPGTGLISGTLTYASAGTYTVTVSVSDGTAAADQTFAWTVTNVNQPPTLTDVPDRTDPENTVIAIALAGADLDPGTTLTYSATPLPAGVTINPGTGLISGTLTYASAGSYTVALSVSDGTAVAEQSFTWTVTDVNQSPTLTDVPDRTDPENTVIAIALAGADLDPGTTLTYSATSLPAGVTINAEAGLISGTLTYVSAGTYTVTVSVSDGTAAAAQTVAWTVTDVNRPPTLTDVPDRTDPEHTIVAITLAGADLDQDTTLTYSATPLPAGVTLNAVTGLISGTLTYASAGSYTVALSVSDGTAVAEQSFTWTITDVNQSPTLTDVPDRTDPENTVIAIALAGADLDPGTTLTYSAAPLPAGVAINPGTGLISGTLTYASAGSYTVTVSVSDGTASAEQTFTWTVTNVNQPPTLTAVPDRTDPENTIVAIALAGADLDPGTTLTYSAAPLPAGVTINPATGLINGTLTYASAGSHTVTVSVSDGTAAADQTFAWTVTNVNQPPTLTDVPDRTDPENTVIAIALAGADLDPGTTLTYSATPLPAGVTINPGTGLISGTLTYASAGTATVTVSVSDGTTAAEQSFTWTVTDVNQLPTLTDVPDRTDPENTIVAIALVGADLDPGTTLTYSAAPLPAGVTLNAATGLISGTLTYASAGTSTVTVSVSDGAAAAAQTFAWTVTDVNRAPTLTDVPDRTDPENTVVAIALAGADLDPDTTLIYSATPLPAGVTLNAATGLISGTLTYASAGTATVTVSVSDGTSTADQTFAWTVTNVNQPPTLTDVPDRTDPENTVVAIALAGTDPDSGTTLTYSATPLPAGLTLNAATGLISGTLTYASAGSYTVTASVSDGTAAADQTFAWTVTNVNQPPTLTDVPDRTDPENTIVAIALAGADFDPETTLTYSATPLPAGVTISPATGLINGTLTYASAGTSTVTVSVSDGTASAEQTFTWTVTNVNQPPTLTDVPDRTDPENTIVAIALAAADLDPGTTLTYSATPLPAGMSINPGTGLINGTLTYASAGTATVTVSVSDGTASAEQTFTWTVTNVNQPPTLTDVPDRTDPENTIVAIALAGADLDPDTTLTYSAAPLPAGVTINPGTGLISGTLTYASAGSYTVALSVSDGTAVAEQSFTWTITDVNQSPTLTDVPDRTDPENTVVAITLAGADLDPGTTLTYSAAPLPAGVTINSGTGLISGTLTYASAGTSTVTVSVSDGTAAAAQTFAWTVTDVNRPPTLTDVPDRTEPENTVVAIALAGADLDPDTTLTYSATPLPAGVTLNAATGLISGTLTYASAGPYTVTVSVSDGTAAADQTFAWTVTNVNQPPTLTDVPDRTDPENTVIAIALAGADLDPGTTLTYSATPLPAGVTLNPGTGLISGTLNFASAGTYTVTVSVSDGTAAADQTFAWTVTNVNQPPTLTDVPDRTDPENTVIAITLAGTDLDPGTTLTYGATPLPAGVTINPVTGLISGALTYASAGTATVTVSVSDGTSTADQTFAWTVTNVNQPPTLTDVPDRTDPENTVVAIPLAGADPDSGTTLTYSAAPLPAGVTINPVTGLISGTLTYASAGTVTVTVSVSDGTAAAEQTFTWTVTDVNQPPTLTDVPDRTDPENTVIAITLAGADLDPGTTLTYSAAPLPAGVTINPGTGLIGGTLTYASAGTATVTVSVSDGTASAEQTFTWTVTNVNQPPTLTDVPDRTDPENTVIAIALAGTDLDPGTTLTYSATPLPAGVTINPVTGLISGTLTYASAGTATVTVSVSDGTSTADQTFAWTVTNVNQPPTLTDVPDRTDPENTVVAIPLAGADLDPGTTLTYSATPLPAGVALNAATGLISGTLTYASAGTATVTVSVSDGTTAAEQSFTWTVTDVNQLPTLTDVPDRSDPENTVIAIALAGADLDPGTTLTYSATPLPAGVTINPATGLINGTLTYASAGSYPVTVSVSDGTAAAEQTFAWTVTDVNRPPTLTDVPDRTEPENTVVAIPLAGADLDPGTTLTYSAAPLPAGLTLNAATGLISGTLTYASAGTATVTLSVSDGTAAAEQTFTWTINDVNRPPMLTGVPDRTNPENTVVAITLAGADPDPGTTLTYSATTLPAGVTINPGTGLIGGTLTYASAGTYTVTVSVSDGTAAADQTFAWTVTNVNQLPTLTDVPDRADPENTVVAIPLAGADLDPGTTLTYSAAPLPAGVTINPVTGLISGTLTYASAGAATVTVSVSDGTAAAQQAFTWTVTNVNRPPTLTAVPDRTDSEHTIVAIAVAGADLDPGTMLTYSATPLPAGMTINPVTGLISGTLTYASGGTYTITVSVSDGTAAANQTFAWTVTNVNQLPTLTAAPDRTDPENTVIAIALAGGDLDPGTTLTYSATPLPAGVTINPATGLIGGTLTYVSAGSYTVTVSVSDGTAAAAQTFAWTVTDVNRPPTLTDVPDRTDPENTVIAIALAGADLDPGTTLTYSATPLPAGVTLNTATGLISGTLTYASAGTATVTVSVSDGTAAAAQTFAWTVTDVNRPPTLTAVPDRTDPENTVVAIPLAGTDPDSGTTLTYSATPLPAGITTNPGTGLISGTLTYASAGTYTVTVSVSDGTATADQTFAWTVTNVNQPPTLTDVPDRTDPENTVIAITLAGADLDPSTTLTYSAAPLPAGVTINPVTGLISGTFTYASAGTYTVTVSVSDGTASAEQTFTWAVTNVNQPPTLTDVSDRTDPENTVIAIALAGTDLDPGTTLTYSAAPLPAGVTINPGTGLIGGTLTYASAGTATVTVSVSDGTASADQTFTWTVTNVNRPPTLTDVPDHTDPENTVIAIALAGADLDPGTTLTYSATPLPAGVTINPGTGLISGTLTYASAGTATVTVSVSDGTTAAEQSFTWTVTDVNQLPTLTDVPDRSDPENTVIAIALAGADLDPGTTLTYSATPLPAGVTINPATGLINGTLTYASAGSYPVTVSVSDGTAAAEQTFAWTVTDVNRPPTLTDVPDRTEPENTVVAIPLAGADLDPGTTLTYSAAPLPAGLTLNAATGLISGTLTYASAGTATVTLSVSDGTAAAEQTFTWTINDVNRPPMLTGVPDRTNPENTVVAIMLAGADPDPGTTLTYSATTLPAGMTINPATGMISGTLTYASAGTYTITVSVSDGIAAADQTFAWTVTNVNQLPTLTDVPDRADPENTVVAIPLAGADLDPGTTLTYSAAPLPAGVTINPVTGLISGTLTYASAGAATVTVSVSDGTAAAEQTFTWTVTNVNRPPTLTAVPDRTDSEHTIVAIAVAGGDLDPGTTLTYSAAPLPAGITINPASGLISGTLTYASAGTSTVTVSVSDGTVTANQTFAWTVTDVNQPPTLTDVPDRTDPENTIVAISPAGADLDPETTLTYSAAPLPAGVTINPATGLISGTLTYASAGTAIVTVSVSDGTTATDQTFAWTVTDVNQPPTLTDVPDRTDPENTVIAIALTGTDLDPATTLTYSAAPLPAGITINPASGLISGTLTSGSVGISTVTVSVSDGTATTDQTFAWTVTHVNRAPILTAVTDPTSAENATITLPLEASDPDGDSLTFSATGLPDGLTIGPTTGVISGKLSYASAGTHAVTVTVTDPALATGRQTFSWTVTDKDRAPVLTPVGHLSTTTEVSASLQLVASDPDGNALTYSAIGLPPGLSLDSNTGLIGGTPTTAGVHTVTATAAGSSLSHSQVFVWTVVAKPVGRVKFIQANSSAQPSSGTAVTVRMAAAQAAGQLNVVVVGWRDAIALIQSVTDTAGNVYTLAVGPTVNANLGTQAMYYAKNVAAATAGGNALVVTFTTPPSLPDIRVAAYAGIDPVNPVDVTAAAQGTGAMLDSGARPTTFADDLLIGASLVGEPVPTAAGAGYTSRLLSSLGNLLEEQVVSAVGSYRATATGLPASQWIMQMVAFRDPNHAPTLTNPGPQISTEHEMIWVELAGRDQDDEPLTYSVSGLPPSLTLNASTGVISGTLSYASAGIYTVTATASDSKLQSSPATFTWTVTDRTPGLTRTPAGDFTGDGKSDVTVYRPSTGTWVILKSGMSSATWSYQWGQSGDLPVRGDYDGDGLADVAVFRPSDGHWFIRNSSTNSTTWDVHQWGGNGDIPVPGDYDGDGKTDMAVYRPSTGTWFILKSSTHATTWYVHRWGELGDRPVPGDYDGDGRTDIAVFRPSDGNWFILKSSTNATTWSVHQWGGGGDVPVPGDYDGDAKTDVTVYRPSTGTWFILKSSTNATAWDLHQWGGNGDIPGAGDYDGDGKADATVYRPSTGTWFVLKSSTSSTAWDLSQLGEPSDIPVFSGR